MALFNGSPSFTYSSWRSASASWPGACTVGAPRLEVTAHRRPANRLPRFWVRALAASLLYLLIVFVTLSSLQAEGHPDVRDGQQVWMVGDTATRALTPGEDALFRTA